MGRYPVTQGRRDRLHSEGEWCRAAWRREGGEVLLSVDREALLDRINLVDLFGEFVGPARKEGSAWRVRCPNPSHVQTGKTPPAVIDSSGRLWNCHGCPEGGSAIDLVVLIRGCSVGEAMAFLSARVGLDNTRGESRPKTSTRPRSVSSSSAVVHASAAASGASGAVIPDQAELESYVERCEVALWSPEGREVLDWLRGRCIPDEILRLNRVGADTGRSLPRSAGLPKPALAAVFPVLDQGRRAVYLQQRPLKPAPAKYINPDTKTFGTLPRLAVIAPWSSLDLQEERSTVTVLVCEGIPDALVAAGVGYRSVAVLGTQTPDQTTAEHLVRDFPTGDLVLAFDADRAGVEASLRLEQLLATARAGRRVWRIQVPEDVADEAKERDLNRWAIAAGDSFPSQLKDAVSHAASAGWKPLETAADLVPELLNELADQAGALAISTGFQGLDTLMANGGWRPGLVLVGGLPGIGKSAMALQACLTAARDGHPVLYVSVEQSEKELLGRLFCRELQAPISSFWNREPGFAAKARSAAEQLPLSQLYVRTDPYIPGEDHQGTVGRVRRWAEEIVEATRRRPLVVVDYLQRMRPPEAERRLDERLRISVAGLGLRQLARDLDVPVLVISSIGRGSYEGLPKLDWFKGSGDLEYDADACLILRPSSTQPLNLSGLIDVELHLVKNRYGKLTQEEPVGLIFDRRYGTFRQDPSRSRPAKLTGLPGGRS